MNGKIQKQSSRNQKRKKKDRHEVLSMRSCRFIKKRVSGKVKLARKIENGTSVWNKEERWHNLVEEGSVGYAIF